MSPTTQPVDMVQDVFWLGFLLRGVTLLSTVLMVRSASRASSSPNRSATTAGAAEHS